MTSAGHPRYLLHQRLGAGGMAEVHLGTLVSPAGERLIAIKRVSRKDEVSAAARARLLAEARLVFQLTHANVCQVLDVGENDAGTFIVMEYVRGCDLGALLAAMADGGQRLDPAIALYIAREVARALDFAHRRTDGAGRPLGLVHGDVSPRNVLLSVEGEVKLADFGIARALGMVAPGSDVVGGTPGFTAPEVASGSADHRSDIFGLGAMLARALGLASAEVSAGARAIIERAMAPSPAARFASAGEVERALALELARRHPGFTPSVLALVVRRHGEGAMREGAAPAAGTLFAMKTLLDGPEAEAPAGERGGDVTATALPRRRHSRVRRRWLAALALLGLALAATATTAAWHATTTPKKRPSVDPEPPAATAEKRPSVDSERPSVDFEGSSPGAEKRPSVDSERPSVVSEERSSGPEKRPSVDFEGSSPGAEKRPSVDSERPSVVSEERSSGREKRPSVDRGGRGHRRRGRGRAADRPPDLEPAYISVTAIPWAAVYIDGKRAVAETPVYRRAVTPGRHIINVRYHGRGAPSGPRVITLDPGELRSLGFRQDRR
ncbi:MAG TPA: protein kinase [Kofleriaceae bacterium]|nr:protein kinase [Kofleriaceae bacterium]